MIPIMSLAQSKENNYNKKIITKHSKIPEFVKFKQGQELPLNSIENWLSKYYDINNNTSLELIDNHIDELGITNYRYKQKIDGYLVELSMLNVHEKNGLIKSITGNLKSNTKYSKNINILKQEAIDIALRNINADLYKWDVPAEENLLKLVTNNPDATYYPSADLVIINNNGRKEEELKLSYKINISAIQPPIEKTLYIDTENGNIIWQKSNTCNADTTGNVNTIYSGQQQITFSEYFGNFRLSETSRGNGIHTYNCNHAWTQSNNYIINSDPTWDSCYYDTSIVGTSCVKSGLDAHWGTEVTYDYFLNQHSRNSIDGYGKELNSFVHYSSNYQNAFYNNTTDFLTYGDGLGNMQSWANLPIVAHEITHGLTHYSADLIYQGTSGALNESFSDIFGAAVDFMFRPNQANWLIGEEVTGDAFRNMADPNSVDQPSTFGGEYWRDTLDSYDNGGVHFNSAIQNLWYVLLVDGGNGINDNGDSYDVTSIGMEKATKIAYRNLTSYLTPTSNFQNARFYSILSAIDIYGIFSTEHEAVTNAWHAVGVGDRFKKYVRVPDNNFEAYLEANAMGDGILNNDTILYQNIYDVDSLDISNLNIFNITGIESFSQLTTLDCSGNNIDSLTLNQNINLKHLYCSSNTLFKLDLRFNTNLELLVASDNNLNHLNLKNNNNYNILNTNFDIILNPNLTCIDVDDSTWSSNNWTNIDIQHYFGQNCPGGWGCTDSIALNYNPNVLFDDGSCDYGLTYIADPNFENELIALGYDSIHDNYISTNTVRTITSLYLYSKNISSMVGIEDFVNLEYLNVGWNNLDSLDVSKNSLLTYLNCYRNNLTSLDVSHNLVLDHLNCNWNNLDSLNVSNNLLLTYLDCYNNDLTSLDVIHNLVLDYLNCGANYLDSLNVSNNSLLTYLNCYNNDLTSLDVSHNLVLDHLTCSYNYYLGSLNVNNNSLLTYLNCTRNFLDSLDVSHNLVLDNLNCSWNNLDSLDVSHNSLLTYLNCYRNNLTNLDVSHNLKLDNITCNDNNLDSLDISQNSLLTSLNCNTNNLTSLDVSHNSILTNLYCSDNNLTSLDVSHNSVLYNLSCGSNNIDSLNFTSNNQLRYLNVSNNILEKVDLRNGNNTYILNPNFTSNNNLFCINVDDVSYSNLNWTNKDWLTNYSNNCSSEIYGCMDTAAFNYDPLATLSFNCDYGYIIIPDSNFEAYLEANAMGDGILNNDSVLKLNIKYVEDLYLYNLGISDFSGIEEFDSLKSFRTYYNPAVNYDFKDNTVLDYILIANYSSFNDSINLNVRQNPLLNYLNCSNSKLNSLDLSNNPLLETLYVTGNNLRTLNISNNPMLNNVRIQNNLLDTLNTYSNPSLLYLYVNNNNLKNMDVSFNHSLRTLNVSNNYLKKLDVSSNPALTALYANDNSLNILNVKNGNNYNMSDWNAQFSNNPNLFCIEVDDPNWSNNNWTSYVDTQSVFNNSCFYGCVDSSACNFDINALSSTIDFCIYPTSTYTSEVSCVVYTQNNIQYYNSGSYIDTVWLNNGCYRIDSIDVIIDSTSISQTDTSVSVSCAPYTWILNGQTYNSSGIYLNVDTNSYGCIDITTLDLEFTGTASVTHVDTCYEYLWHINNFTYDSSGVYVNLDSSSGCLHIDTLQLNISNGPASQIAGPTLVSPNDVSFYSTSQNNGHNYFWTINNNSGYIINGQYTNVIGIQWYNNTDTAIVCLTETDIEGCDGDTVCLTVEIANTNNLNEESTDKKLLKIVNILGQDIANDNKNNIHIYIYEDGKIEKKAKLNK